MRPLCFLISLVIAPLFAPSAASATTDVSTLTTGANTAVTLNQGTDTAWTVNSSTTVGTLAYTHTNGTGFTLSGPGSTTLTFSNSSTPTWTTSTYFSVNDYVANLSIVSSTGLSFTGKSNALILQSGVSTTGIGGTFTIKSSTDGSILYAQGNGVLPANASFAMEGGSGSNNYRYSKLVINGGTTQTIGALSSTGVSTNTYIAAWNGNASLLVGTGVSSGTNVLGATSAATLRVGNDNASASFAGVIGSGYTTGGVLTTDSSTQAINLVKLGTGTQTLTGVNTYTGFTTVSAGTLALTGTGSLGNTSALSVAAGATLNVSGLTTPALNLATAPLTLGIGSATKSFLNVGTGTLTLGSTLTLNFESATLSSAYDLYDASTVSGSFSGNVAVTGSIGTGSLSPSSGVWSGTIGAYILSFNQSNGVLSVSPSGAGTPPSAPASLTVTNGFEQVSLVWSAVADAVSYTVKRSTTSGSGYVTLASGLTGTTYTDITATPGITYYYVVAAVNVNGESDPSPSGSAVSSVRAAIGLNIRAYNTYGLPVTDLVGVVRKSWWNNLVGPVTTGESATFAAFTDYLGSPVSGMSATFTAGSGTTVKLGSDAVTVAPASNDLNLYSSVFDQYNGTASTLSVTGIPYSSYDLVVYVYDGGSSRGGTLTANGATLAIRGGAGSPAADGTGYVRSTDATNTSGSSVQQGNYVRFTGLTGNLTASFVATNMGDFTQRLKIAGFQILSNDANPAPSVAPAIPTGLTASGGNRQVALNWSHTATATSYKVYRGGTLLATVTAPVISYADSTAVNGTAYSYTVSAVNAIGASAVSTAATATPAAPAFTLSTRDVYQYSIAVTALYSSRAADPMRRAYLWVPPGLTRLQGVIVGLHNMLEKPMFEDPVIRQACADAGLGIVFISPGDAKTWTANGVGNYTAGLPTTALDLDPNNYGTTETNPATGSAFTNDSEQAASELAEILRRLGVESGYTELQYAPILLAGHSAASPFVWTRSVHTSSVLGSRVFAILPYKGTWGSAPDGMPVFHVSSEWQEISFWGNTWEVGDAPGARGLRAGGVNRLIAEYVQPGTGHYDYSETQSGPIATFIKRAAQLRIPTDWTTTASPTLNTLAATSGYLVDVTTLGSGAATPVAYADWIAAGKDPLKAYWYLDQQTAQAACDAMNAGFSKKPQLISGFSNASTLPDLANQSNGAGTISFSATLQGDGVTFQMRAASLNQSPIPKLFHGAPVGIPTGSIQFKVNRSGALKQTGVDTFRVWLDRGSVIKTGQPWEPFVIAWHPGDANYRMADRPIALNTSVPVNLTSYSGGSTQTLTFPTIANQSADALSVVSLGATSSAGGSYPAQYWMVSGPYRTDEVDSGILVPDTVPAGSKFPARVMVGAWQWGKPGVYQSAAPAYRTFWIFKNRFQKWQFEQFGYTDTDGTPVTPAGSSEATADPDGDGLNNLLEYALGGNQSVADSSSISPVVSTGSSRLQLTFNRIADPALVYTVQATDRLSATWTDIWTSTGTSNVAGSVTVPDSQLLSASPKRFLRLKITQ